jgi:HPt (histidine-containing phosphotransfer) domain-containing protein
MRATHEHCIAAGMNDFVTKPVSPDALLKTLSKWLGPRNGHEPALAKELVPTPAVGDKPCVFNRAIVLKRMMGDEELANRVIEAFLADVPRQIQALKNLLAQGDADGSGCLAHSIKGAAASVGGEFLTKVALRMEKSADAGDLGAVNESMAELEAQFLRLRETITEEEYA